MRKPRPVGLIASGQVAKPYVALLTSLPGRLGPVKALAPRVASRIVNRLRTGFPVARYEDLEAAGVLVICVENQKLLGTIVEELAASGLELNRRPVILLHPVVESSDFPALEARGARLASFWTPEETGHGEYLAEGDRQAIREFRQALGVAKLSVRVLRKSAKPLYWAGLSFASSFVTPLAGAAVDCLRKAGLNPPAAFSTLEQAVLRTLRAYRKAGKKGWVGPLADPANHNVRRQYEALQKMEPALAEFFRSTAALAGKRLGRGTAWMDPAHPRSSRRS